MNDHSVSFQDRQKGLHLFPGATAMLSNFKKPELAGDAIIVPMFNKGGCHSLLVKRFLETMTRSAQ